MISDYNVIVQAYFNSSTVDSEVELMQQFTGFGIVVSHLNAILSISYIDQFKFGLKILKHQQDYVFLSAWLFQW